jgi:hypothetical protein
MQRWSTNRDSSLFTRQTDGAMLCLADIKRCVDNKYESVDTLTLMSRIDEIIDELYDLLQQDGTDLPF